MQRGLAEGTAAASLAPRPRQRHPPPKPRCNAEVCSAAWLSAGGGESLPPSCKGPRTPRKGRRHCWMIMNPQGICCHLMVSQGHAEHVIAALGSATGRVRRSWMQRGVAGSADHSAATSVWQVYKAQGFRRMPDSVCTCPWPDPGWGQKLGCLVHDGPYCQVICQKLS